MNKQLNLNNQLYNVKIITSVTPIGLLSKPTD